MHLCKISVLRIISDLHCIKAYICAKKDLFFFFFLALTIFETFFSLKNEFFVEFCSFEAVYLKIKQRKHMICPFPVLLQSDEILD